VIDIYRTDQLMPSDVVAVNLPMTPDAPGLARRAVDGLGLDPGERDRARLLASELVTNALLHSEADPAATIRIWAQITGRTLRLTVTDRGTGPAVPQPRGNPGVTGGFGLLLVDRLAARWGVERNGETTVWCELPLGNAA
jgi:anti-sigma regulatory factor (Ser/Thr protein kinase)